MNISKVHYCINPFGFKHETGAWLITSIRSVLANTRLKPVVIYSGVNDENTILLEKEGAEVKLVRSRLVNDIANKKQAKNLPDRAEGALLRFEIPFQDLDSEFSFYVDCDTYFFKDPDFSKTTIDQIGAAVTNRNKDESFHFNSGVLIFNNQKFIEQSKDFFIFLANTLGDWLPSSVDEMPFNVFYKDKISIIDPKLNWRPFFGISTEAEIVHFHGFKVAETVHSLSGDYRDKNKDFFENDYKYAIAQHVSRGMEQILFYINIIKSKDHFTKTILDSNIDQLIKNLAINQLTNNLLFSYIGVASARYSILRVFKALGENFKILKDIPFEAIYQGFDRMKLTFKENFSCGRLILYGENINISFLCSKDVYAEVEKINNQTIIQWCSIGIDGHLIIYDESGSDCLGEKKFNLIIESVVETKFEIVMQSQLEDIVVELT